MMNYSQPVQMVAPSSGLTMFSGKLNTQNQQLLEQMFPNMKKRANNFKKTKKSQ